ncbi:hypothetical protein HK104_009956 [Borealophlyctis nickersoniae]|nr:hypothetical protein HK104_009956 [Borealophlyctis nickersoniae]
MPSSNETAPNLRAEIEKIKAQIAETDAKSARLLARCKMLAALNRKLCWWSPPLLILLLVTKSGLPPSDYKQFFKMAWFMLWGWLVGWLGMVQLEKWIAEAEESFGEPLGTMEPLEQRPERTEASAIALPAPPPPYAA